MFNVEGWLISKGINYSTSGNNVGNGWIGLACPWCSDIKNHLGINLNNLIVHCWKCNISTHITKLIQEIEQCSYPQAKQIIESDNGRQQLKEIIEIKKPADSLVMPEGIQSGIMNIHRQFLINKNLDPNYITKKYKLMSGGLSGWYKFKLVLPYYKNNQIMTFSFRDTAGGGTRYRHYSEDRSLVSVKHMLYNEDNCHGNTVVVVEGVSDCWRMGNSTTATSGTQWTNEQLALLVKYEKVMILFDAEEEAQRQARKLAMALTPFVSSVEVLDIGVGDPGELTEKEVKWLRKEIKI